MTGAGFGGCTINLVGPTAVEALRDRIERDYPEMTGRTPTVWVVDAVDGAGPLSPSSSPG
jgi:galactokinase